MPKFKRPLEPGTYLTAADMLDVLSRQQLSAAALQGSILLAAQPAVAWLLDCCCIGKPAAADTVLFAGGPPGVAPVATALAATSAAAGVNRAPLELQQQYELGLHEAAARRQRRGRKGGGGAAAAPSAAGAGVLAAAANGAQSSVQQQQQQQEEELQQEQQQGTEVQLVAGANPEQQQAVPVAGSSAGPGVQQAAGAAAGGGAGGCDGTDALQLVQLSFQEAFFLSAVLHCCQVALVTGRSQAAQANGHNADPQQQQQQARQLSAGELWSWCCDNSPGGAVSFVSRYAAYHHFRSKGWIPQPGLIYGADYVLYELHPEHVHSDYAVSIMLEVVQPRTTAAGSSPPAAAAAAASCAGVQQQQQQQQQQAEGGVCSSTQLLWLDAHIMQRLTRQVLKQLLLFYVVVPQGLQLDRPDAMQSLAVREVLIQRWQPSAADNRGL